MPETGHSPSDIRGLITAVVKTSQLFNVTVDSQTQQFQVDEGGLKAYAPTTIFHTRISPNFFFSHTFAEVFEFADDIKVNFTKEDYPLERQLIKHILKSGHARVSRDSYDMKQELRNISSKSLNRLENSLTSCDSN